MHSIPIIYNMCLKPKRHSAQSLIAKNSDLKVLDSMLFYFLPNQNYRGKLTQTTNLLLNLLFVVSAD